MLLGSPCNVSVCYILQTSPKIWFSYTDTHGTIQATHSLVPWTDPAGTSHLVGACTGSTQAEALVSFPSTTFDNFVGSKPLDHGESIKTMPQFVLVSLLWPTTLDIPVNHPIDSPLPEGSYNVEFTTSWLAAIHFLATKNQ
eukprot:jgi/Psemu1/60471/gm1.60471_g